MSKKISYRINSNQDKMSELNHRIDMAEKAVDFYKFILSEKNPCDILKSGCGPTLIDVHKHPGCDNMSSKDKRIANKNLRKFLQDLPILYEQACKLEEVIETGIKGVSIEFSDPNISLTEAKTLISDGLTTLRQQKAKFNTTIYDKDIQNHERALCNINKGKNHIVEF